MNTDKLIDAIGMIDDKYIEEARTKPYSRGRRPLRRVIAVAAAALLCVLLGVAGVSALAAADDESAYELLYSVTPGIAQMLKPVRMACEDNGVRMYVESAGVNGSEATVLVSLRDLEGDRVDETTDLFDSYSIRRPFDSSASCEMIGYNDETKTASYLVTITRTDDRNIPGGKVTFSVACFLSGKEEHTVLLPSDPVETEEALLLENPPFRGGSGEDFAALSAGCVLAPGLISDLSEGVQLTAMGFIDGRLHLQVHYEDILHTDNHGFIYLLDADGNRTECVASTSFWDEENSGSYEEYVFDIGPEEYDGYTICGDFTTASRLTEGHWQVTFPLG